MERIELEICMCEGTLCKIGELSRCYYFLPVVGFT